MREVFVYLIAALAVLGMLGYSVHMIVGGLVSTETERWIIIATCIIGAAVIGAMALDVIKRRRG